MESSQYIYYDTENENFVFTDKKKSGSKYIRLPLIELIKIYQKNLSNIKNYITRHDYQTSFFYFSCKEINKLALPKSKPETNTIYNKPTGIWLSYGSSWLDYVSKHYEFPNKYNLFTYTYKVELYDTVKVITDKDELFKFIKKYKKKPDDIRIYDIIDWEKVKEDYSGLVIAPHLGSKIWRDNYDSMVIYGREAVHDYFVDLLGNKWKNNNLMLSEWYRGWECACGVIWNISSIASFKLCKKSNHSKYVT